MSVLMCEHTCACMCVFTQRSLSEPIKTVVTIHVNKEISLGHIDKILLFFLITASLSPPWIKFWTSPKIAQMLKNVFKLFLLHPPKFSHCSNSNIHVVVQYDPLESYLKFQTSCKVNFSPFSFFLFPTQRPQWGKVAKWSQMFSSVSLHILPLTRLPLTPGGLKRRRKTRCKEQMSSFIDFSVIWHCFSRVVAEA